MSSHFVYGNARLPAPKVFCYFCDRPDRQGIKYTPDPAVPRFEVCNRKTCVADRAQVAPSARRAKYEARQEVFLAEQEEIVRRVESQRQELRRRAALDRLTTELTEVRIQRFGDDAVKYARKLTSGWVCPCQSHNVAEAAAAAVRDEKKLEALTEVDIELLAQHALAESLEDDRLACSGRRWSFTCGSHLGRMSAGHAEVRRNVAKAHGASWVELDLRRAEELFSQQGFVDESLQEEANCLHTKTWLNEELSGLRKWFELQSWFVTPDIRDQVKLLEAVAIAETQPIPAHRCDACGKAAGLDYSRILDESSPRSYRTYFTVCVGSECLAKRERVKKADRYGLQRFLSKQRDSNLSRRKKPLEPYPAPGPLPPSTLSHPAEWAFKLLEAQRQLRALEWERKHRKNRELAHSMEVVQNRLDAAQRAIKASGFSFITGVLSRP